METHHYKILDVLGHGGFGTVYRARMQGEDGFVKDVAVKLLNTDDPPEDVLRRFRDESRILGLIRDRAVVRVDPPTRLHGRWAVLMEYVDGTSAASLTRNEPMPPRAAVEVIEEVARALDSIYTQKGPDGEPLKLLHRDLKPANLQITPSGEVKILDFGIARADFEQREAHTTKNIAGTFGYIAPERFVGEEGPAGDIYSLGVVLQTLVTAERPSRKKKGDAPKEYSDDVTKVLALAARLMSAEPEDRPTAAETEALAIALSEWLGGQSLRVYARESVPIARRLPPDDLVGSILSGTLKAAVEVEGMPSATISPGRFTAVLSAIGVLGVMGMAGIAVVVASLLVVAVVASQETVVAATPLPVAEAVAPVPAPVVEDEEVPREVLEEVPEEEVVPAPVEVVAARPTPKAVKPAPKTPSVATLPIMLGSVPMGATVFIDGKEIGLTPLLDHPISKGKHTLKMVNGDDTGTREIDIGSRTPKRYIWEGGQKWQALY